VVVGGVRKQAAERTEAELKAAAVRVFERVGYLNAKITDITAEAGRATGSFYKHFAGKEQLLEALLADMLAEGDESATQPGHRDDFREREAVRYHVAAFWSFYRRNRTVMTALQQAAIVDTAFARRLQELMEPDQHHIADHLTRLDLPGDPLVLSTLLSGLMNVAATTWQGTDHPDLGRELTDDEAIETLTSFIWSGLGGGRA
jgi:AcrR family transcriptional regulator